MGLHGTQVIHLLKGVVHQDHRTPFCNDLLDGQAQFNARVDRHDHDPVQIIAVIDLLQDTALFLLQFMWFSLEINHLKGDVHPFILRECALHPLCHHMMVVLLDIGVLPHICDVQRLSLQRGGHVIDFVSHRFHRIQDSLSCCFTQSFLVVYRPVNRSQRISRGLCDIFQGYMCLAHSVLSSATLLFSTEY